MADSFLGEIRIFAGNYAPIDWAICDGSKLSISGNQALFSLIGTTFGGDGVTDFQIPDLRSRLPIGMGTGPGLTARVLGQTVGADTVTLTEAQMPVHTHTIFGSANPATDITPGKDSTLGNTKTNALFYFKPDTTSAENTFASGMMSTSWGGSQAHNNTMPSLALTYIISLNGVYPTPN
ncbi:phage tail protein [Undibacterium curvum]|uniref:Phage tail protein n=1 Tax=Undibacterium curvum TaxID=2762294 RepID=A0ABR7A6A1_9BURK|nr:tail fiber protein [Undibacterium curvum]MBC3932410.1 phage tail protein [Undibacterium curvum]